MAEIIVDSLTALAEQIELNAARGSDTTTTMGKLSMPVAEEQGVLELVSMARTNGCQFLYTRRTEGALVVWEKVLIGGSPLACAWLLRRLDEDRRGNHFEA